jgi:LysR family glycine cleavage system transcriptional activator
MERRLAAILAIDVVGYSRLMERDEPGTFGRLQGRFRRIVEPMIARHGGRVFKTTGDGLLVEFASVVAAVECAASLQRGMAPGGGDATDAQEIEARMAIHLGDVIVDGEDLQGEGVIIAARLQELADPGGLVVSRAVHDQVRSKLAVAFEDLGDATLRNISDPVRIFRVSSRAQPEGPDVLTVTTSPNFAAKWLVHRLGGFAESHPEIDLRIGATLRHVSLAREDVDVAIRHGEGHWPGLHVTKLASEELFPVCSPKLLDRLREPADVARHTLLHVNDRADWQAWLAKAGVAAASGLRGIVYNQASMAIDAAADGQGIALARTALAAWDLRKGRLVRPFRHALDVPYAYWIICSVAKAELPKVATFRRWLLDEAAADARELARMFG